ncbi:GPW/gp25 family protein [Vagococcus sp. WN89Y]|uniref:GPW/gp25 family protein n=1 Tax=Vagococcus sp. WN89Y TaxID=3457258 RepID=UPI003FCD52A6
MTIRYSGLDRSTGRQLTDTAHIRQSISDILRTPVGSRVMRRDYGSQLFELIDQPQTPALEMQIWSACYRAILQWEPRIVLSEITTERQFDGKMVVNLTGALASTGEPLSLTLPVS